MNHQELLAALKKLNKAQLQSLGVSFPLKKGWKKKLFSRLDVLHDVKKVREEEIIIPEIKIIKKKKKKQTKKVKIKEGFYQSWEWKKLRYKVLLKYKRQCMCCGAMPPNITLVVDHIKPRSKFPELELKESNLQILCRSCNMGKSNKDETDFRITEEMRIEAEEEDYWKNNL